MPVTEKLHPSVEEEEILQGIKKYGLTPAQEQIYLAYLRGHTTHQQVADLLSKSRHTIKNQISNSYSDSGIIDKIESVDKTRPAWKAWAAYLTLQALLSLKK